MLTISSSDTLIIRTKMPNSGAIYTLEMQQRSMSNADIQTIVDTLKSRADEGDIVSLWKVSSHDVTGVPMFVEDITEQFDVRTIDEIEEQSKRALLDAERVPSHAARMQRAVGTHNHAQQGIAR